MCYMIHETADNFNHHGIIVYAATATLHSFSGRQQEQPASRTALARRIRIRSQSIRGASRHTLSELRLPPRQTTGTSATDGALRISSTSNAKRSVFWSSKTARMSAMLNSLNPHWESRNPVPFTMLNSHDSTRLCQGRTSTPPLRLPHAIALSANGASLSNSVNGTDSSTSLISTHSPFAAKVPRRTL